MCRTAAWMVYSRFLPHFRNLLSEVCGKFWNPPPGTLLILPKETAGRLIAALQCGRHVSNLPQTSGFEVLTLYVLMYCLANCRHLPRQVAESPGVNHRPRRLPTAKTIYAELFAYPAQLSPQAPNRRRGRPGLVPMGPPVAIPRGIQSPAVKKIQRRDQAQRRSRIYA